MSVRSRNLRLTVLHAFFRYAAFETPAHAAQIQRLLAIPSKRFTQRQIAFFIRPEVDALLAAPDPRTWFGRRDHTFLLMAVQTGLRLSDLMALTRNDVTVGTGAHVRVIGKGGKEPCTPLAKSTIAVLKAWWREPKAVRSLVKRERTDHLSTTRLAEADLAEAVAPGPNDGNNAREWRAVRARACRQSPCDVRVAPDTNMKLGGGVRGRR